MVPASVCAHSASCGSRRLILVSYQVFNHVVEYSLTRGP